MTTDRVEDSCFEIVASAGAVCHDPAMTVPLAMRDPRLRRFQLRRLRIPVNGGRLSIVAPRSMDSLLEGGGVRQYERCGYLPYWADIWPASVAIARAVMRGPSLVGRKVLDLGCGVGVAGVAAVAAGAEVTFADRDEDALAFAMFNASQHPPGKATVRRLDWDRETLAEQYDVILLADVAYEIRNIEPLLRHLRQCLLPAGIGLLGDPYRRDAGAFLQRAGPEFALTVESTSTWFDDRRIELRLVTIRKGIAGPEPERLSRP